MGKRYVDRDPTANTAIANVMRENKGRARRPGLTEQHPDLFAGLMPHEARELAIAAWRLSGSGDLAHITREHVEQARCDRGD